MNSRLIIFFFATLIVFSSCKKDDFDSGVRQRVIRVELNNQFFSTDKIDSAFLYTEFIGPSTKFKMKVKDNSLETRLTAFSQSTGKLMIQLYTSKKFEGRSLQFEKEMNLDLTVSEPLVVNGPSSMSDLAWKPRVILDYQSASARYTAVVALRPSDSYFEIQNLPAGWNNRVSVYRGFYRENYLNMVYGHTWNCNLICGNQADRTSFQSLLQRLNGIVYDKMSIEAAFFTSPNTITELSFEYDK